MTTFERQQRLTEIIRQQPGIRVPELARLLSVSEGTVRNDLRALDRAGQLKRVRGGAIADKHGGAAQNPVFIARARVSEEAKRRIARWAAELVEDGDTLLFDASTTVYYLAEFLKDRRNLTVVTNGLEIARSLAQNSSNNVILLGGLMRADGTSVSGTLSHKLLEDLYIKTAFLSCTGITLETGLMEVYLDEAQLKRKMIQVAGSVVALIDSSKFGKIDLTPFAALDQITHIFTDSDLDPQWVPQLQKFPLSLTVCSASTITAYQPHGRETRHYRLGFANLTEDSPFCIDVRRGLERAAHEAGNIDLIIADNQLNGERAVEIADQFVQQNLDLVIEYQIDAQAGNRIMDRYRQAGIPVIAVDIPLIGATFFGVDNYRAGYLAGAALGEWIQCTWGGQLDRLIVLEEPRAGALPGSRIQGMLEGVHASIGEIPADKRIPLNSGNTGEVSEAQMAEVLKRFPDLHRLAVMAFNDDAAMGALAAARKLQRENDLIIVGQGADRRVREELKKNDTRLIGSTAYQPEQYGEKIIPLALKILRGEPVPPAVYLEHTFVSAEKTAEVLKTSAV
ncbi:putative HTH-type transcriptional regulator YdjF [Thermoflexales bacterium]|nr:putative HTH-type transcriptional regulator YdjF [Thermoflexales bacterium]